MIITCTDREHWLQERRKGIGASDIGCLLGVPEIMRFVSPWSLWASIVDDIHDESQNHIGDMGHRLEPVIAGLFRDKAEYEGELYDPGDFTIAHSDVLSIAQCTVDRVLLPTDPVAPHEPSTWLGIVELKAAWWAQAKKLIEDVPLAWQLQVNWQMHCTGVDHGYFAVLCDGLEFKWYKVERHERIIKQMVNKAEAFWDQYVLPRKPPPTDYTEATTQAIKSYYREAKDTVVALPSDAEQWHRDLESLKAKKEETDRHISAIKNKLRAAIGENSFGLIAGDHGYSFRNTKVGRVLRHGKRR